MSRSYPAEFRRKVLDLVEAGANSGGLGGASREVVSGGRYSSDASVKSKV